MGKKESLNPFDYKNTNTQQSTNPFDYKDKTPIEQDFNIGNTQAKIQAEKEFDENINAIMDKIPELNKEERNYLMKVGKSGQLTKQEIQSAIDVMRGADVKQQQMLTKDGELKEIAPVTQVDLSKGVMSAIGTGVENLYGATGKAIGQGHYYMKDNGRGVLVPVPLAVGERPEAGYTIDSVWGSQMQAEDDNRLTDIAKKVYNLIPSTLQGILALPETAQGIAEGKTSNAFKIAQQELESFKFKTASEFDKGVIDTSKVENFSDLFKTDTYDFGPDKIINTSINVGASLLQLFATRGALGISGKAGAGANLVAGYTTNLAEPLKAADELGIEGRGKYLTAAAVTLPMALLEQKFGIEGKLFTKEASAAKNEFVKTLIKDNIKVEGGQIVKESLDDLFEQTIKKAPSFYQKYGKNVISEATEEVAQNMIMKSGQIIHDQLVKDDPDAVKYNANLFSAESVAEYMNDAIGGVLGGGMGSFMNRKNNKQSETAYTAIAEGKEDELKVDLASSLKRGKITQDEYDRAIFKIDAYKEYFEATKDKPIDDDSKRKIFDLTYEKQNLKSAIETLKEKNPNGINDPFIAQKESELKDITSQVNEIWTKANPSTNPVAQAKAEVPAWRVSLNDFTTEIKNPDKTVSQKLKTKADILKSTGIDTSLNKLAKAFNIEFKTPRVPEESGPIQVKDGILYEPYMTEKTETKDSELKTRGLPVFAFEDKDGGTWLFAAGEQTKADVPDTSYLIKLNEDGSYGGHEEFHYETPKMNMLSFDDIPQAFTRLGLQPVATSNEVRGYKGPVTTVAAEEIEEEEETEAGPDETLYNEVFADVKAGKNRGKLTALPNNTFGVIVNGRTIPFASSAAENSYTFKENFPDGDVEVGIEARENIPGYEGTGLMVMNLETGAEIGYLRATEKSGGKKGVNKSYDVEQAVEIPKTLTEQGQKVLDKLKTESEGFEEIEENGERVYKKNGVTYKTVSAYLNEGLSYTNESLREAAKVVGKTFDVIVKDYFQGKIQPYSAYKDIISLDDYNDIIATLNAARNHAIKNGFSIITDKIILADEKNKVAGSPNILMVNKNGDLYVYDTVAIRSTVTQLTGSRRNFNDLFTKPTGKNGEFAPKQDRIIAKLGIFKDILENDLGIQVKGVGAVPFEVDYKYGKNGENVKITHVKKVPRYDFKENWNGEIVPSAQAKVQSKQPSPTKTTAKRVTMPIQAKVAPIVEPAVGEEMPVSNLIDKRVEYKGKEGVIKIDEGGKLTFESGDTIVELTTKDVAKEIVPETFALEDGKVKLGTETFDYVSTNRNSKGEIVSVNLKNSKGKVITKRDAELATVIDRTINKSTVDNAMTSSPEFKKEVKSTINRKFKEEFLGEANRVIDSMPDSVADTFVEMESGVSEKSTEELQLMVLEAAEWASKAKAEIKKSKAPDFEKRSTTNMLEKFEKDLNKYYAKLDKQRKSEITAAAKEKARLDFERAGGKIKKSFSEEELNTLSQGKTIEVTESMTEEDFIEDVYSNSENPAQIASAYLMSEVENKFGETKKSGSLQDIIYEFFKNGGRLTEEAFRSIYDVKLMGKKDLPGRNRYINNEKGITEDLEDLTIEDSRITPEDVVNFIRDYPNGPQEYAANIEGSMRSKLASKFKDLTGKVLNPNRARELHSKLTEMEIMDMEEARKIEAKKREEAIADAKRATVIEKELSKIDEAKLPDGLSSVVTRDLSAKNKAFRERIIREQQEYLFLSKDDSNTLESALKSARDVFEGMSNKDRAHFLQFFKDTFREFYKAELADINRREAKRVAEGLSNKVTETFTDPSLTGEDISNFEGDVPYQKKSVLRNEKAAKVKEYLQKILGNKVDFLPYNGDKNIAGYVEKKSGDTKAKVYINEDYAGLDTPIHEVGHILIDSIGYNNRVIQAAIKQLKDTLLWKEIAKAYPELNEEGLGKEVLAEAIGREGAGIFEEQTAKSKFKQFLDYIFDKIKQLFGVDRNIAKSMAKQVLAGKIKVTKDLEIKKQEQKTKSGPVKKAMLDEESYYRIAYGEKRSISLDNLRDSVDRYKAMADADPTDKTAARKYEDAKNKVEEFERSYKKYRYDYNKLNKLKEEKGNLDGKSFDELVEIYNIATEFDPLGDNSFLNDVKYRIAYLMAEEQRKFLESKGHSVKPKAFNDIKGKDVFMKSLAHMTEAFPEMQYLSKAYDAAVREMNMERREKQMKLDALAKSVAKEESKTLGLKMKDFLTGKAYEFFKWMDKNGELISTEDAYKLSKAKGDYVKFYREIREEYKDLQENTPAGYDENALLMTDKNFAEKLSSNGIVSAIQSWLGTNSGMRNVVMNYTHSDKRTEPLTLAEIEVALQNEANKGLISAAVAAVKSIYYNTKAKKLINKGVDEEGNDISHLKNQGDYMLDKKGKLVNKFGTKRPDGYDYSKDFHAAMVQYLTDMTWTKHMQPLIPMVESVEQYSKATGATKGASKNLAEWIKDWKRMHLYKEKPVTKFPELDLFMRFLRKMTSLTSLAFNVKASVMNLAVGEYNNWKELGGKDGLFLKGHKRLVSVTPGGKKKFSTKAYNILMKNNVIATDYDETPTMKAGQIFTYLGMGMTKLAEYTIQGSMFLGQIPNDMWKDFDAEGNYKGSDPNYKEKLEQYKTKVSDIHGKYSAKDRRNFELYELGKFLGQFKTWIPDWWKERFGEEYIDQYGKRHKGVYRDVLNGAILELRKDIMKPEFWTSDKLEYVNARKNLKAAMVFGILLAINAGGDDDKKRRKKADFLTQAIGNLTFIFDPEQAKYMLKTPVAGMSYANNMLNLITDLSLKNAKKVTPYAKLTDAGDMFED